MTRLLLSSDGSGRGGVIDLMAALNASVKKAKESRGEGEHATIHEMKPRKKATAKKAPAKKTAAKAAAKKTGARKLKSA
ncbi:hypothetical protein ACFVYE_46720 [Streptomyces sp. NPDC058239]|uniref:hypothetical protein n=1 Tax=Streptomyces sp. NPDC058239 TaxID=3346395 RepID=UPI0036E408D5